MTDERFKEGIANIEEMISLHLQTVALLRKLIIGLEQKRNKSLKESKHGGLK